MSVLNRYIFAWLAGCFAYLPAFAEPDVQTSKNYYAVSGMTADDIRASLTRNSPVTYKGKKHDARTDWQVSWNYYWHETPRDCKLTRVNTSLEVSYTLPRLTTVAKLEEPLKSRWNNYYEALLQHEQGHQNFGLESAREIETTLHALGPRKDCETLQNDANSVGHRILQKYAALEKSYDRETNHGIKNGAVFP
jgi:predicted secreted Zn-dependent protease